MNNLLLIIAAFLVFVLTTLFAVPPLVNWNDFRGVFEEEASRLLDREVRVRGDVSMRILPVPYVSFEQVRIADAPGVPGSFARAEKFKMWLSVPPLLRGVFEARQIELEEPVIRLRTEADGSGNWRKLQISEHNLAYIPSDVAFKSVLITAGTLLLESHHGHEIARLDKISGEMTALALTGPYKFIGTMPFGDDAGAVAQEVRLSTARAEDNGDVRFSGSVRSPDGVTVHNINGTMSDLLASARVTGQVTSRSRAVRGASGQGLAAGYELAADLKLDAEALRLDNIAITFLNQERQQTLNGTAVASWQQGVVTETDLKAGWLDLDAIAGAGGDAGPLKAVEGLLVRGILPLGGGVTSLNLSIDQANLAGTAISDLRGRMVRRDGVTKIEALRVALPGLSALAVDGFVERREDGLQFDGNVLLRSASFAELAQWGGIKLSETAKRSLATAFSLTGNVRLRPKSWELSDAYVRLADAAAEGRVRYDWSKRPSIVARIDADRLNLDKFGENLLAPARIASYLGLQPVRSDGTTTPAIWRSGTDITLDLRGRRITDGSHVLEDVDVSLERTAGVLDLRRFALAWQSGLKLALSGRLSGRPQRPTGALSGLVTVANDAAGERLTSLLNLASQQTLAAGWMNGRTPLRVAVDARIGTAAADGVEGVPASHIVADGTLGADRVRIDARTFGRLESWHRQPGELQARISGRDAFKTTRWLLGKPLGGAPGPDDRARADGPGTRSAATIVLTAAGRPDETMKTHLRVDAGPFLNADFNGEFGLTERRATWSGTLDIRQATARTLARLTWPSLSKHVAALPLRGRVKVANTASGYRFEPEALAIGKARLSGKVELAAGAELPRLSGAVSLSEAALPRLAGLVMRATPGRHDDGARSDAAADSPWPDTPFDFAHFDDVEAGLDVTVASLALGRSASPLRDAAFRVALSPGQIKISDFSAKSGTATLVATAAFERSQAGAKVSAKLSGKGVALGRWAPQLARANRLAGTADFDVQVSGRALSPRSLATALDGRGVIRLSDARVPGMTTETITGVARKIINGDLVTEALARQVDQLVTADSIELGGPTLKIRIANGTLALPAVIFDQDAGGLRNDTFIDLPRMRIDSRWTVTPEPQPKPDTPDQMVALPSVSLVYAGALASIEQIDAKIDLGDLERELVVRKMEANVERLERLRREDEARAAAEAERQRRIEEEQRRSLEEERRRREEEERRRREQAAQPTLLNPPQATGSGITAGAPQTPAALPPSSAAGGDQQSAAELRQAETPQARPTPTRRSRVRRRRPPPKPKFDPFNNN